MVTWPSPFPQLDIDGKRLVQILRIDSGLYLWGPKVELYNLKNGDVFRSYGGNGRLIPLCYIATSDPWIEGTDGNEIWHAVRTKSFKCTEDAVNYTIRMALFGDKPSKWVA